MPVRLIVALTAAFAFTLSAQSAGVIEGRLVNSVTGEAVVAAHVRFLDRKSYVHDAVTDYNGAYRLTGLSDGDYRGEFTRDGFSDNTNGPFSHLSGDLPVHVDAQLKPWGSLRGRVLDEDGKPAAGLRVEKESVQIGRLDGDTVTDANGEFVFKELPAGSYTIVAKPAAKIRTEGGVRLGTVSIYYPAATGVAQAARIPVRAGDNVSGIEIRLKSVPVHRVTGAVLNQAGKPAAGAIVKLMGAPGAAREVVSTGVILSSVPTPGMLGFSTIVGPRREPEVARVTAHADGTFEFTAVERGDWRLSAQAGDYDDPLAGVASALVSDKDVEDIQIGLSAPFPLQVSADWGGAQPPAVATHIEGGRAIAAAPPAPRVLVTPLEGQPSVIAEDYTRNMQRMNSVLPGRYRVMPGFVQAGFYVAAVMWGGRDVVGQVVDLAPGAGEFHIIYKSGLGKVSGTVDKGDGVSVFLISHDSGELLTYRQVPCGPGGAFEIRDVSPGDYYVVAFDRAEQGGLPAADLPGVIVPFASSVSVGAGATASLELRSNRWPW